MMANTPLEAELGWSSLNQDVMAQVAARLGLRDCLAAALTCKHWRAHITRGTPHTSLRIDDVRPSTTPDQQPHDLSPQQPVSEHDADSASASPAPSPAPSPVKAAAAADSAAQLLDSARRLMPHVEHLSVSVYSRCRQHDYLLKHMRALSRWSGLTSLDISWDTAPDATNSASTNDDDDDDDEEEGAQSKAQGKAGRHRRSVNGGRSSDGAVRLRRSVFGPLCLGVVGLMRGVQRLSITAAFGRRRTGLFGLAQLEHLTHLELRQAPGESRPIWRKSDAELGALTSLRSLAGHAALLGPHILAAVGPHLTRLELERFDVAGGYDSDVPEEGEGEAVISPGFMTDGAVLLMHAMWDMKNLRLFRMTLCDSSTDNDSHDLRTRNLQFVMAGLATLANKEQEAAATAGRPPVFAEAELDLNTPLAPLRHDGTAGFADGDDDTRRRLRLTEDVLEVFTFVSRNLTRLAVGFGSGEASSLHKPDQTELEEERASARKIHSGGVSSVGCSWNGAAVELGMGQASVILIRRKMLLGQLTRLTHLELRADRDVHVELTPASAQALCSGLGARLRSLALELPATCLGPEVVANLRLLTALRSLKIMANPHLLAPVALDRREVERRLLAAAARQCVGVTFGSEPGGSGSGSSRSSSGGTGAAAAEAGAAAPSPAVLAEVNAALTPLMFLQELFTAMEDVEGVQQSLQAEAEWRAQHLEDVTRRLAAARVDMAAAEQAVEVVQAAALEALAAATVAEGDAAEWEPAAATAAAAVAMEAVEAAVVVLNQRAEELAEADAVAAAAGGMPRLPHWVLIDELEDGEWDLAAAAALAWLSPAAYGDAAAAPPPPSPEPRPLDELSTAELDRLWWFLFREEVVTGPVFRMGAWLPRQLEALILGGFNGIEAPPLPPQLPQLPRRPALPALVFVQLGTLDHSEAEAMEQQLRELSESGAAPALRKWNVLYLEVKESE
ncbi:hypothetical protein HYH02_004110 [Chlamydomonas schloesseri]|uniref:F-box domain-containing protein n=1 Tax=Chlamydomonas schloesseri TaxID=2026947 RepID=A0A835WPJ6_9CHLO|nr:hypothetical protein HYH02_004110 [Chlamydomonas schloesseri]|eukprot:KAG2451512.1 hypothetical protein HYH02_004110 [Chlamydomonas schloesseri]